MGANYYKKDVKIQIILKENAQINFLTLTFVSFACSFSLAPNSATFAVKTLTVHLFIGCMSIFHLLSEHSLSHLATQILRERVGHSAYHYLLFTPLQRTIQADLKRSLVCQGDPERSNLNWWEIK